MSIFFNNIIDIWVPPPTLFFPEQGINNCRKKCCNITEKNKSIKFLQMKNPDVKNFNLANDCILISANGHTFFNFRKECKKSCFDFQAILGRLWNSIKSVLYIEQKKLETKRRNFGVNKIMDFESGEWVP